VLRIVNSEDDDNDDDDEYVTVDTLVKILTTHVLSYRKLQGEVAQKPYLSLYWQNIYTGCAKIDHQQYSVIISKSIRQC